jgi:hypothetical protein
VAIYRVLHGAAFDDDTVKVMTTAYEAILQELEVADRSDPLTEIIARKVIDCACSGETDPDRIREIVLKNITD